jgi:flagellar motor component MotA
MMLEGVVSILEGMNPRMLETKLLGYLHEQDQERIQKEPVQV